MCKHNFCWTDCTDCRKFTNNLNKDDITYHKKRYDSESEFIKDAEERNKHNQFEIFTIFLDNYLSESGISRQKVIDFLKR